ncbi:hypothetical protein ACFWTE_23255 [Nocardiopsis sp. NPDC058631]|uniref:hypothetical protein n=1 Tax=Nocardiopsis sp. NPDC058631 TaxID=3346566 RepID=UPI003649476B
MSTPAPPRLPRSAVFAGVCVGVSATGHGLSSGHGVSLPALLLGGALVLALAHATVRSEQRLGALTARMLWSQAALHLVFTLAARPGDPVPGSAGLGHTAVHASLPEGADGAGADMLLAHAAAGLVGAWWLRQGERAAFDLLGFLGTLLRGVLLVLLARPRPVVLPGVARFARTGVPAPRPALRYVRVVRGPPATA